MEWGMGVLWGVGMGHAMRRGLWGGLRYGVRGEYGVRYGVCAVWRRVGAGAVLTSPRGGVLMTSLPL